MLLPVNPQFRKRRRRARRTQTPAGLTITSVEITTASTQLKITFSAPVTWNGVDVPYEFRCVTSDGLDSCINVLATGADWIEVEFNGSILAGAAWQLDGAMAGITPAVQWPQNGTVAP